MYEYGPMRDLFEIKEKKGLDEMKKRTLVLTASVLACFMLASCGGGDQGPKESTPATNTPEPPTSVAPVVTPTPEPAEQANVADLGDYHVEIKGATLTEDYEGKPAIIVTYAWTNNSEETTSSMTSVSCSAFQDGVELETAIITGNDAYDSDAFMKDVRPGTTLDIQSAFLLSNTTSPIEIEVGEWITFDENPPIAYLEVNPGDL